MKTILKIFAVISAIIAVALFINALYEKLKKKTYIRFVYDTDLDRIVVDPTY